MGPSKPTFQNQRPSNTSVPICVAVSKFVIASQNPQYFHFHFTFHFLQTPTIYKVPLTLITFTVKTREQRKLSSISSSTSLPSNVPT